ncbi:MAG TPA: hypothetical protein VKG01_06775 [Thermoanaerobaculia bacterium]|nr:hypothetical protein [Thermoanaerobaculia bacterium]
MRQRTRGSVFLGILGSVLAAGTALAAGPPIDDYIVYGENGVKIGVGSTVTGLVGARNNWFQSGNTAVRLNGTASVQGDVRSGGNVSLGNGGSVTGIVYHAVGTTLTVPPTASVGGEVVGDPLLPSLPAAAVLTCPTGGANYSGANSQSLSLSNASPIGDVTYGAGFTVTLTSSGNYFFNSISTANGAKLVVQSPPVHIYVCQGANFGSVETLPTSLSNTDVKLEAHGTGDAFSGNGGSNWIGDVYTPNGSIHFGGSGCCTFFNGRFWAGQQVDIEHGVTGTFTNCCSPLPRPNKDSTIIHGDQNTNNGANYTVRVRYQVSGLFGFFAAGIVPGNVQKAYLVLRVQNSGLDDPPHDWPGGAGNLIKAYRLVDGFEDWAEGNGFNFPTVVYRGDGNGVTWNCATDTDIANYARDCSGDDFWDSGGQTDQGPARSIAAASPNQVISNNMPDGAEVWFDVTADVQAGLGPQDLSYMSWFVRKPSGSGFVSFYSREGAAIAGDPTLAPKLVTIP